jgi:hypothetical protein
MGTRVEDAEYSNRRERPDEQQAVNDQIAAGERAPERRSHGRTPSVDSCQFPVHPSTLLGVNPERSRRVQTGRQLPLRARFELGTDN